MIFTLLLQRVLMLKKDKAKCKDLLGHYYGKFLTSFSASLKDQKHFFGLYIPLASNGKEVGPLELLQRF